MSENENKMPWWARLIVIAAAAPVCLYPLLLERTPEGSENELFLWFYPIYVVVAAVCAWICWARRREVYWILIVMMLLTHAAMFML